MYVAPGTLDQRLRFYRRDEAGADGFSRPVYQFTSERWGRVDAVSDRATVPLAPQAHVEHRTDAVATIAEDVIVDPNGVVIVNAALYFVRGVVRIRQLRCQRVTLEAIDPTSYATFELFEDEDVLDGLHLVVPAVAFSSGFSSGFSQGFA
jgi:hypothetical protein